MCQVKSKTKKSKAKAPASAWGEADGGALNLFTTDEKGEPAAVGKSLIPKWNSFTFFRVSPVSWHEVSEVTSKKTRVSISGWFHGAPWFDRTCISKFVLHSTQACRAMPLRYKVTSL